MSRCYIVASGHISFQTLSNEISIESWKRRMLWKCYCDRFIFNVRLCKTSMQNLISNFKWLRSIKMEECRPLVVINGLPRSSASERQWPKGNDPVATQPRPCGSSLRDVRVESTNARDINTWLVHVTSYQYTVNVVRRLTIIRYCHYITSCE